MVGTISGRGGGGGGLGWGQEAMNFVWSGDYAQDFYNILPEQ